MSSLHVWLHGRAVGELDQQRNRTLRLRFDPQMRADLGDGARPLSLSLPLGRKPFEGPALERWLDNLLPESFVRSALERRHGIRPNDTFAMLRVLGQECAGAVQFTPTDTPPGDGWLRPLSPEEVTRIVRDLPTLEPPDGLPVGASLGGVQAKVLLTRTPTGWAWPADGAMSTHIVKPEPTTEVAVPDLVQHEAWAMRLAAQAGLPVAAVELADFDGRQAIVVERYDRSEGRRTHQEDFAQALGISARDKYESILEGPGRLALIARDAGAQAAQPIALRHDLLRLVTFNLAIGNGDAHSKNYSLQIGPDGQFSLAPLYDSAPVWLLNERLAHFGHAVAGQVRLPYLTAEHLLDEAQTWGIQRAAASDTVVQVLEDVERAALSTPLPAGVGPETSDAVADRARRLRARVPAGGGVRRAGSRPAVTLRRRAPADGETVTTTERGEPDVPLGE